MLAEIVAFLLDDFGKGNAVVHRYDAAVEPSLILALGFRRDVRIVVVEGVDFSVRYAT